MAAAVALAVGFAAPAGFAVPVVLAAAFEPAGDRFQFVQAYDWIPAFGVQYAVGADGIALVLIALVAVLVPVVVLASWYDADPQADPLRRTAGAVGTSARTSATAGATPPEATVSGADARAASSRRVGGGTAAGTPAGATAVLDAPPPADD